MEAFEKSLPAFGQAAWLHFELQLKKLKWEQQNAKSRGGGDSMSLDLPIIGLS